MSLLRPVRYYFRVLFDEHEKTVGRGAGDEQTKFGYQMGYLVQEVARREEHDDEEALDDCHEEQDLYHQRREVPYYFLVLLPRGLAAFSAYPIRVFLVIFLPLSAHRFLRSLFLFLLFTPSVFFAFGLLQIGLVFRLLLGLAFRGLTVVFRGVLLLQLRLYLFVLLVFLPNSRSRGKISYQSIEPLELLALVLIRLHLFLLYVQEQSQHIFFILLHQHYDRNEDHRRN